MIQIKYLTIIFIDYFLPYLSFPNDFTKYPFFQIEPFSHYIFN